MREREEPVLAVFDMEGTIITSNVVESYVWTRMADLPSEEWPAELASVFGRVPAYLQTDRRDRGRLPAHVLPPVRGRERRGRSTGWSTNHVGEFMLQKASAAAIRRIRDHRAAGHRTVLDHRGGRAVRPPAGAAVRRVDRGASSRCATGATRGSCRQPPLVGEARAAWLQAVRAARGRRPEAVVRVRGLVFGPAAAAGGRQPGRGVARRGAVPVRQAAALADRGVGDVQGDAARALPEAGGR